MASRDLDHPLFGSLRRDGADDEEYPWWEGRARIPSLSGCRRRWAFEADLRGKFVGVVENSETEADAVRDEFEITVKDEIGDGPAVEQERAFSYLLSNGRAVLASALRELGRVAEEGYYDLLLDHFGGSDPDGFLGFLAERSTRDGMREMVCLSKIDFCLTSEAGQSLVALNFDVVHPLDDHGLAVVLFKDQVRGGGTADEYDPE